MTTPDHETEALLTEAILARKIGEREIYVARLEAQLQLRTDPEPAGPAADDTSPPAGAKRSRRTRARSDAS